MGIKQHSSFDIHSTLKWSLPWYNIPNGLACRPNPSQCSDKQPMLRDIPKHKKWQWIRCVQPMAITESLRVWTAASSLSDRPPSSREKAPATITQCGPAVLGSLAGQSSHSQHPIKAIIRRIKCEIRSHLASVDISSQQQWRVLLSKLNPQEPQQTRVWYTEQTIDCECYTSISYLCTYVK